jgi:flagellar basal body-associated protein FliL
MFGMFKIKLYAFIVALISALGGAVYFMGRKDQKAKEESKDAKEYIETTKDVGDAIRDAGNVDAAEWLSRRKHKRDL